MSSLLAEPAAAALVTYKRDGSALATPVWFRHHDDTIEIVIAEGDVKLAHLRRDPRCAILIFEAIPPFRGVEVRGEAELVEGDVTEARADIAGRYLGVEQGRRFAESRRSKPGVLLRLRGELRDWDLTGMIAP